MSARILVNIDVPKLKPAIEFYGAAVGAKLVRLLDDDVAEMAYGTATLCLLEKLTGTVATPGGDKRELARHWTPVHVDFVVDDIGAAVERARALRDELRQRGGSPPQDVIDELYDLLDLALVE